MWLARWYNQSATGGGTGETLVVLGGREVTLETEMSASLEAGLSITLEPSGITAEVDSSRSSTLSSALEVSRD